MPARSLESFGPAGIVSGTGAGIAEHPPGRTAAGTGKYVFYWQSAQCSHDSVYLADSFVPGLYYRSDTAYGGISAGTTATGFPDSGHRSGQCLLHGLGISLPPQPGCPFCRAARESGHPLWRYKHRPRHSGTTGCSGADTQLYDELASDSNGLCGNRPGRYRLAAALVFHGFFFCQLVASFVQIDTGVAFDPVKCYVMTAIESVESHP